MRENEEEDNEDADGPESDFAGRRLWPFSKTVAVPLSNRLQTFLNP